MSKDLQIRSNSVEFLIFEIQKKENSNIEVRFEDGDLWLTQKSISQLFDTTRNNITMHIQQLYKDLEIDENSTSKDFLLIQKEGTREVKRNTKYYNLDAVISVGYKVNSDRAIQFRRWATGILKEFSRISKRSPTINPSNSMGLGIWHKNPTTCGTHSTAPAL